MHYLCPHLAYGAKSLFMWWTGFVLSPHTQKYYPCPDKSLSWAFTEQEFLLPGSEMYSIPSLLVTDFLQHSPSLRFREGIFQNHHPHCRLLAGSAVCFPLGLSGKTRWTEANLCNPSFWSRMYLVVVAEGTKQLLWTSCCDGVSEALSSVQRSGSGLLVMSS